MPNSRDRAPASSRLAANAGMALGLALALFGIGIDWIIPESSPGLGLPQLLIIAAGLAIAAGAWLARRRNIASLRVDRHALAQALVITLLTLLAIEIALTAMGAPVYFPPLEELLRVEPAPFWTCDELGCHPLYEETKAACADGSISGRLCIVNRQGFADSQDFAAAADFPQRLRILTLGDSFTQGYTADIGHSYVETLESLHPQAVIWNTAIRGSGTHQALATFDAFAPALKPQLTTLGFVMNDFADNVAPLDGVVLTDVYEDRTFEDYLHDGYLQIRRFHLDRWGLPHELDLQRSFSYRVMGVDPPLNEVERRLGETRLGALALRLLDRLAAQFRQNPMEERMRATREALRDLRDAVYSLDSRLLILVVPHLQDIDEPRAVYNTALQLFQELGLPYLEVRHLLSMKVDYVPRPDGHWNTAGHQKVGAYLSACVAAFVASGDLADCPGIVMP